MKKLLSSKTTWIGIVVLLLVSFDVFKNGVSANNITLASIGIGLLLSKDGETFKKI